MTSRVSSLPRTRAAAGTKPAGRPALPARRTVATEIPVDRIDRHPGQPRTDFPERELDELAASMRASGQLQPIAVTYNPATRRYTLISGERRWRAAQRPDPTTGATIATLHALVEYGLTDDEVFARAVAENSARKDMTPMEEANAFHRLEEYGYPIERIVEVSGKTIEYVTYRLGLLNLIPAAQEALNKGHLLVGTAWYVRLLSPAAQQRFLRKLVRGEFATPRDAEAFAQACRNAEQAEQDGLFGATEVTEERREAITARRRQVTGKMDRLASAGQILADLAAMDVADLAEALAGAPGGVGAYLMRAEHLRDLAGKTAATLRKAKALAAAATPDDGPADAGTLI